MHAHWGLLGPRGALGPWKALARLYIYRQPVAGAVGSTRQHSGVWGALGPWKALARLYIDRQPVAGAVGSTRQHSGLWGALAFKV